MNLQLALILLPGLIIGLTIHEASHALSAKLLGDRTAYKMGRVSLNPFRHLSFLGTAVLFLIGFGWAKPVLVNIYNFKKPKLYYLLTSLAGPFSNLLLAAAALGTLYLKPLPDGENIVMVVQMVSFYGIHCLKTYQIIPLLAYSVFSFNIILFVVNLVPIPPLDGSKIWPCLIPGLRPVVSIKWSMFWIVFLIILYYTNAIGWLIDHVFALLTPILPHQPSNL